MEERRAAGAALLREVMAGNATMIERKAAEKQREAEEDRRILAYIRERAAKAQVRPASSSTHPQHKTASLPTPKAQEMQALCLVADGPQCVSALHLFAASPGLSCAVLLEAWGRW